MLHLTVADRLEPLAERLATVLRDDPADPMQPEWIATPGGGVRTWLWLELARHLGEGEQGLGDGVAANLTAAFPGTLRSAVLRADRGDDEDPWEVTRLTWTVLAVLLELRSKRSIEAPDQLVHRFGDEEPEYGRARRIADLFDRYHLHRPDLVLRWSDGHDEDALGKPLARHHRWQPMLWREVRERIGEPGPPERLPRALEGLRNGSIDLDLPRRLSIFGLPALPGGVGFIELASAVARNRDVHLFLLDPSPEMSSRIRVHAHGHPPDGRRRRIDDPGAELVHHPLLRSWARLPRETAVLLADAEASGFPAPQVIEPPDPGSGSNRNSLLARIQSDLRAGAAPDGTFHRPPDDRSLEFHTAHGRVRQVDIAREVILHALADDPTLTEEDILVICPALDAFEPLVRAGFGPSASDGTPSKRIDPDGPAPSLRHRVADRSIARENPVIAGLDALLETVPGRLDAITLQDLLAEPALRARHRLTDEDLARISDWVAEADIRWGLDAEHRAGFGIPTSITTNSWGDALDRLLLGSTLPDDETGITVGGLAPIGIEGDDVELAGRLAAIIGQLRDLNDATRKRITLTEWLQTVRRGVDGLLAAVEDEREIEVVRRVLADIEAESESAPGSADAPLATGDIRRLLGERLAAAPSAPPFFRGGVTTTSPDSLRGVPHRMIIMLGMDQAAFGVPAGDGDDLAAISPLLGDREPRAGQRQAILDALLAARERVVVIRDGADLQTNQVIPPAVLVSELHDLVLRTLAEPPEITELEIHHPRQPFDERCFVPGQLIAHRPWSFDPQARSAALARRDRAQGPEPFLAEALTPATEDVAHDLHDLIRAVTKPVGEFLGNRLQVRLPDDEDPPAVQLPIDLAQLRRWKVGNSLLQAIARGQDPDEWMRSVRRRGTLPPGVLGDSAADEVRDVVRSLLSTLQQLEAELSPVALIPIDITLPDGTRITGTVDDHHRDGWRGPVQVHFGKMKAAHRLSAWLQLMALIVQDPTVPWQSSVLADGKKNSTIDAVCLRPHGGDADSHDLAVSSLQRAVDILRRSRREPLPIFPDTSAAIYEAGLEGKKPKSDSWRGFHWGEGDADDVQTVFGDIDFDELLGIPTRPDDPFPENGRAGGWARYLWELYGQAVQDHAPALLDEESGENP